MKTLSNIINVINKKTITKYILYAILIILFLPVLYYATHTPFSLIDDYGDWHIRYIFTSGKGFITFVQDSYLFESAGQRYRPSHNLYLCFVIS